MDLPAKPPQKPLNLTYGVDDRPPLVTSFILAIQHLMILATALLFPVLLVNSVGGSPTQMQGLVSLTMIAGGVGTILQALKKGPIGSGYLAPEGGSEPYLPAAFLALQVGGFNLLFGMTIAAGLFGVFISRFIQRLRFLFPPEVTGVIVFMVGASLIPITLRLFFGADNESTLLSPLNLTVAAISFASMVGVNIWGKGSIRQYCLLCGMIVGYILSFFFSLFAPDAWSELSRAPFIAIPHLVHTGWSFDFNLLPAFLIAAVCASLKAVGDITTCQKINDANWKRPDMKNISQGILAEGIKTILGGLLGGLAHTTSSANVGLSVATGATSRFIAYMVGGIFIFLAFFPKLAVIFSVMPAPVMGALLVFCVSFMMLSGIQIFMSRMMDTRKTIIIGTSIIFGISVDMMPGLYVGIPSMLQPFFTSSLTLGTVVALLLNLLFRLGIAQKKKLEMLAGEDNSQKIFDFMEIQGGLWGAQREVVYRASSSMSEFMETVASLDLARSPITMEVMFDEFNLNVGITYQGVLLEFPDQRPTEAQLLEDDHAFIKLSGFLMRHYADQIKATHSGATCQILFHFDH